MDGNKKKNRDNEKYSNKRNRNYNYKYNKDRRTPRNNGESKEIVKKDIQVEKEIKQENSVNNKKASKTTFNLIEVIIIMVITVLFGLLIGSFITYTRIDDDNRSVSCSAIRKDMTEFAGVYDDILNEYYGTVDKEELLKAAIKGMVEYLGDPYSGYIDVEEAEAFNEELEGEFVGIGVEITSFEGGLPTITRVYDDTPASRAELLVGDVFYKIDGNDLNGLTVTEASSFIKNKKKGTKVELVILRNNEELTFEIATDTVELESVVGFVEKRGDTNVGVITISTFAKNTFAQFKSVYEDLKKENITSLVIDVRDNNGGYLSVAKDIASLFLDKDTVIYQKDTKGEIEKFLDDNGKEIDLPVVFVTNCGTASAAEVLVAALKENLGSDVVGTTTYGKGTIQKLHSLSDGAYVKYTVQTWLTPRGNAVESTGLVPTYYVDLSEEYLTNPTIENDNQLQEAFNLLFK